MGYHGVTWTSTNRCFGATAACSSPSADLGAPSRNYYMTLHDPIKHVSTDTKMSMSQHAVISSLVFASFPVQASESKSPTRQSKWATISVGSVMPRASHAVVAPTFCTSFPAIPSAIFKLFEGPQAELRPLQTPSSALSEFWTSKLQAPGIFLRPRKRAPALVPFTPAPQPAD